MTHQDAVQGMAVERYLLGELTGPSRDHFEEHLFDCGECADDVKQGAMFLEAAKAEMRLKPAERGSRAASSLAARGRASSPLAWLWGPRVLAPALAACLAVIVYQTTVQVPHMREELAELQTPTVMEPLVLANAGARGGADGRVPEVAAPRHGSYLLTVDIPAAAGASGYRCSLVGSGGAVLWHLDVSPQQVHDAVTIQVPVMTAQEGMQELRVQSIAGQGGTLVDLATYRYRLVFIK